MGFARIAVFVIIPWAFVTSTMGMVEHSAARWTRGATLSHSHPSGHVRLSSARRLQDASFSVDLFLAIYYVNNEIATSIESTQQDSSQTNDIAAHFCKSVNNQVSVQRYILVDLKPG